VEQPSEPWGRALLKRLRSTNWAVVVGQQAIMLLERGKARAGMLLALDPAHEKWLDLWIKATTKDGAVRPSRKREVADGTGDDHSDG